MRKQRNKKDELSRIKQRNKRKALIENLLAKQRANNIKTVSADEYQAPDEMLDFRNLINEEIEKMGTEVDRITTSTEINTTMLLEESKVEQAKKEDVNNVYAHVLEFMVKAHHERIKTGGASFASPATIVFWMEQAKFEQYRELLDLQEIKVDREGNIIAEKDDVPEKNKNKIDVLHFNEYRLISEKLKDDFFKQGIDKSGVCFFQLDLRFKDKDGKDVI